MYLFKQEQTVRWKRLQNPVARPAFATLVNSGLCPNLVDTMYSSTLGFHIYKYVYTPVPPECPCATL